MGKYRYVAEARIMERSWDNYVIQRQAAQEAAEAEARANSGTWDDCGHLDAHKRVVIKADCLNVARRLVHDMNRALKAVKAEAEAKGTDLNQHLEELETLLAEQNVLGKGYREHQVLAGVAGASGAGKTSAINAWLGFPELLPSNCQQAATAVVCLVSWNYDLRPDYNYRAEIDFYDHDMIRDEVGNFFDAQQKLLDHDRTTGGDGVEDDADIWGAEGRQELVSAVDEGLKKIQAVWGYTRDQLKTMTTADVFDSKPEVVELLRIRKVIINSDVKLFSDQIRPYLDSSGHITLGDNEHFSVWPLVKTVRMYLRAEILQDGLTLVDLPGLSDSNKARAQVARDFFPRLAVTIAVAQAIRAADDQTAHEVLDEQHEIRLQLDGKYHKRGYGFVLSKVDDMDPDQFMRYAQNRSCLAHEQAYEQATYVVNLGKEIRKLNEDLRREKKILRPLAKETKQAAKEADKSRKRYRKAIRDDPRTPDYTEAQLDEMKKEAMMLHEQFTDCDRLSAPQQRIVDKIVKDKAKLEKRLVLVKERKREYCIKARSEYIARRIQAEVADRQANLAPQSPQKPRDRGGDDSDDERAPEPPIQVMPICSTAYWKLKKGSKMSGFPTMDTTGIPQVREWLREVTLPQREEHLDTLLAQYSSLLNRLYEWSRVLRDDETAALFTSKDIEGCLAPCRDEFNKGLSSDFKELEAKIQAINPLRGQDGVIENCLKNTFMQAIGNWSLRTPGAGVVKMFWSTYGAILRRGGDDYKSSDRTEYKWMDTITVPALRDLRHDWSVDIHRTVPQLKKEHLEWFDKYWATYSDSIEYRLGELNPNLKGLLRSRSKALAAIKNVMRNEITAALAVISDDAAVAHPELRKCLQASFAPIFNEAYQIRGTGSYEARRERVYERSKQHGRKMLKSAFKGIEKKLDENKAKALQKLAGVPQRTTEQVEKLVRKMIKTKDDDDGGGGGGSDPTAEPPAVTELKREILELSTTWQVQWASDRTGIRGGGDVDRPPAEEASDLEEGAADEMEVDEESGSDTSSGESVASWMPSRSGPRRKLRFATDGPPIPIKLETK